MWPGCTRERKRLAWAQGQEEGKRWSREHRGVLLLTEFPLPCLCCRLPPRDGREATVAAHGSALQFWTLVSHGLLGS